VDRSRNRKLLVSVLAAGSTRSSPGRRPHCRQRRSRSALANIKPQRLWMSVMLCSLPNGSRCPTQHEHRRGPAFIAEVRTARRFRSHPMRSPAKPRKPHWELRTQWGSGSPFEHRQVGVDGMNVELVSEVLTEVALTLKRTEEFPTARSWGSVRAGPRPLEQNARQMTTCERILSNFGIHPASDDTSNAFDLAADGGNGHQHRRDQTARSSPPGTQ